MIPSACTIAADPPSIVIASVFDVALEPELLPDVLELKLEPEPPPQAQSALAAIASKSADAEIVLVSSSGAGETQSWLASIEQDTKVNVTLRVLAARMSTSDFQITYNPRGLTPYFCHVDKNQIVTARGGLHTPAWAGIVRKWNPAAAPARNLQRYR